MASEAVKTFNDQNFGTDVLSSGQPVLVDFWAPWCGPCRMLAPMIDQLATEYAGKVVVGKVNVDESPETAMKYGIQSIPTVLVIRGGEVVDQLVGVQPKARYASALEAAGA